MELKKVFLVIADISGYTKFLHRHQVSLIHAEKIIIDLLESIIDSSEEPLVMHELLGDAVTFYAIGDESPEVAAKAIYNQVHRFHAAFNEKEGMLISNCSRCTCEACTSVGKLRLKAIMHYGEAAFTQLKGLLKIAGQEIILAHRLLKNGVPSNEYLVMSEAFVDLIDPGRNMVFEVRQETYDQIGTIDIYVEYLGEAGRDIEAIDRTFLQIQRNRFRIWLYLVGRRVLGLRPKAFRNLPQ